MNDFKINKNYEKELLVKILKNFDKIGEYVVPPGRNEIKRVVVNEKNFLKTINIKKFKKPNFISNIIYKYMKGSKAKRSFEYAKKLLEKNIGTPEPIAYFDKFGKDERDYYISEDLKYDFTCREIFWPEDYEKVKTEHWYKKIEEKREKVIRQFAKFSYDLHEKGIQFEDYSPGNVLIVEKNENFEFYLVDLNRMKFDVKMNIKSRMKNVSRMMEDENLAKIFCNEYAKCCKLPEKIFYKNCGSGNSKYFNNFNFDIVACKEKERHYE